VEYVTPLHPLVRALAADARRRLLQVYPAARGLPPRRLAALRCDDGKPPSVLFTLLATIQGGEGLLEERLLGVRVAVSGDIVGDPQENLTILRAGSPGDVGREELQRTFSDAFDAMREQARQEAVRWVSRRAEEIRAKRRAQAEVLRRDLETDVKDRLREIDDQEKLARVSVRGRAQLELTEYVNSETVGFAARRVVVEAYRKQRLEEIARFEVVEEPREPRMLGALFLVPAGGLE
jgi:hypothetical protein